MKLALYKGRNRLLSKLICYWTQSPYSHVELIFGDGMCGSSHDLDLGVRLTVIDFDSQKDQWDFIEVDGDEVYARQWFEQHKNEPYDYEGLVSFVLPIKHNPRKWTCVKAVLTALGFDDAWRFEPSMLPSIFKGMKKRDPVVIPVHPDASMEPVSVPNSCSASCACTNKACRCKVAPESRTKRTLEPGSGPCGSANCSICSSPDFLGG